MTPLKQTIFRPAALEGYMQGRAQTVLPRFIAPPAPLCLWLLLSFLIASSVLAWLARVPLYRSGLATVVDSSGRDQRLKDKEVIVAFFPPETQPEMRIGQNLSLKLDPTEPPLIRPIAVIEPGIFSPADARKKFNLDEATARSYQGPAAIAIADLGRPSEKLPASAYQGIVVEARVEIGSQRVIALLPLVGRFFQK